MGAEGLGADGISSDALLLKKGHRPNKPGVAEKP